MSRIARTLVQEIGHEIAMPLARAYCRRFGLQCDTSSGIGTLWFGAFVRGALTAVVGLAPFGDDFFVSGIYTTGSEDERAAVKMLADRLSSLPNTLHGTIHVPDSRCYRVLRKQGWTLSPRAVGGLV